MKSVIQVTKNDHSSLGGPMGSEYNTTVMETKLFTTKPKALAWCVKDLKQYGIMKTYRDEPLAKMPRKKLIEFLGDCGPVGYEIESKRIS